MKTVAFYLAILVLVHISPAAAQDCTWTDSHGKRYNLNPLREDVEDYFIPRDSSGSLKQDWDLWLNMCRPTVNKTCGTTTAACQVWDYEIKDGKASLGLASTLTFTPSRLKGARNEGVTVEFTGGDSNRKMIIDFVCDPSINRGKPEFTGENPYLQYNFQWKTQHACALPETFSPGIWALIGYAECGDRLLKLSSFGGFAVLYLLLGLIVNKVRGKSGLHLIPNYTFWKSFPRLVWDGIVYFFC